jgi:SOS response regulatory protein OraA/RecX
VKEGIGDAERDEALDALERVGYLDDGRLAATRAQSLADRRRGDEAIRFDLEQRGIDAAAIEDAVALLEPEPVRAEAIAARLGRTPKTAAQLRRNGFSADSVESAVGEAVAGGGA